MKSRTAWASRTRSTARAPSRQALKEYASSFEEGKADVLGLYLITALSEKGELDKAKLMDDYVTFLAGILRSVRFGASDAHGKANMVRFHFFEQQGAFSRDPATGRYRVDFDKMQAAMNALSEKLLTIQGDGDYAEAKRHDRHDGRGQAGTGGGPEARWRREDPGRHPSSSRAWRCSAWRSTQRSLRRLRLPHGQ